MKPYRAIGIMSGTSLDGLDIAYCEFFERNGKWSFTMPYTSTVPYSEKWQKALSRARDLDGFRITLLSKEWARMAASHIKDFIDQHRLQPDFIASHGHTVFHQPEKRMTLQIGDGAVLSVQTGLKVVCDFRSQDVEMGGQGAPLVPFGDRNLFGEYDLCLNLGGFANISFESDNSRIAFDICPCNIVLNHLAGKAGLPYDKGGETAGSGNLNPVLLEQLNSLNYYHQRPPKSLGIEWVENQMMPLLNQEFSNSDLLRTMTEHIAIQISQIPTLYNLNGSMLITGGGAYNRFLVERIQHLSPVRIVIPENNIIEFKEAMVFAFLGLMRLRGEINVLSSVTGAVQDSCSGSLYG